MRLLRFAFLAFILFQSNSLLCQNYEEMGSYNNQGVPSYLDKTNEVIPPSLIADLKIILPDGENLQKKNPALYNKNMGHIKLKQSGDVYLAFVSEGADYKSAIGFYTFKTQAPSSSFQVNNAKLVFPNVSASGSGGGLVQGNRVKLGNFPAGTSIGFFLVSNGFQMGRVFPYGNDVFYSDPSLNPEMESNLRKHSVMLYDESSDRFVLMFEDMNRTRGSDNDFNDAVFLISTGSSNIVATEGLSEIQREKQIKAGAVSPQVDKVITICHYPPGYRDKPQSIQISEQAWPEHQAHGDAMGDCPAFVTQPVQAKPVEMTKDFDLNGDWKLSDRDQTNTIVMTQSGINVKTCNSPRWFSYTRTAVNTFQDNNGNVYWFEAAGRGVWKSRNQTTVITISRVAQDANGDNENELYTNSTPQMITICHYPPGNANNPQELQIPETAWAVHEAHGDVKGSCGGIQREQPSQPKEERMITICHRPPGNPDAVQEVMIAESAWPSHQAHGDTQGSCPTIQAPSTQPTVENKIAICHYPPGNTNNPQEIVIDESAWSAHEAHGDIKGGCNAQQQQQPNQTPTTEDKKIVICHYPPGNPKNAQQLTIPQSAWAAHQKHGDKLGPCK